MVKFRSLSVTLSVTFLVLSMGILLIASGLQVYFSVQAQKTIIASQQQFIAQDAANTVRSFILEKFHSLEKAISLADLAAAGRKEQKLILDRLLGREPSFRQARLLDAHGGELLRAYRLSQIESERLTNRISAELFPRVNRGGRYFSSVYVDEITGEPMVIMAVPVINVFGDFNGILLAETNLKFMWDLVDRIKIGNKGLAYVVDEQGNLIAFHDISRILKREKVVYLEEVEKALRGHEAPIGGKLNVSKGIQGGYVVATHIDLGTPDWVVVVETPALEAYESVIGMAKPLAGVMLLSFIIAGFSGVYFSKKITNPIIKLRDATRKVSKGDLSTRMEIESRDEVGELAGSFNQMVAALYDTTVSVEELKREQKRFQDIAISTGEWIWEVDAEGRYTYSNPVVEVILGYKPEEILGKHFYDFFHLDDRDKFKKAALDIFSHKEPFFRFLNANVHKSGHTVILETSGVPICSAKGELVGYRGVDRDFTERKKAEEEKEKLQSQLLQASKMEAVGTLTGGIAHDFNNILTAIIGNCSLLQMKIPPHDPLREFVDQISLAGERAGNLTKRLLAFSRKQVILPELLNLNDLIKNIEKLLGNIIGEDIELMTILSPANPVILADKGQMEQALLNLAANARDAMEQGGTLMIETTIRNLGDELFVTHGYGQPGLFACISVTDTGMGMDKQEQEKAFEPFYTTKEVGRGTGLGLSITYGIVKQHKGYITIYSEKGRGTTFKIYLPVAGGTATVEKPVRPVLLATGKETIFYAEDDQAVRKATKTIMEEYGYQVIEASDGEDALNKISQYKNEIHLFILDVIMPKKNGKEVFEEIKKIRPEAKVIFTSGYTKNIIEQKGILEDGFHFLSKPLIYDELIKKIREIIET